MDGATIRRRVVHLDNARVARHASRRSRVWGRLQAHGSMDRAEDNLHRVKRHHNFDLCYVVALAARRNFPGFPKDLVADNSRSYPRQHTRQHTRLARATGPSSVVGASQDQVHRTRASHWRHFHSRVAVDSHSHDT